MRLESIVSEGRLGIINALSASSYGCFSKVVMNEIMEGILEVKDPFSRDAEYMALVPVKAVSLRSGSAGVVVRLTGVSLIHSQEVLKRALNKLVELSSKLVKDYKPANIRVQLVCVLEMDSPNQLGDGFKTSHKADPIWFEKTAELAGR